MLILAQPDGILHLFGGQGAVIEGRAHAFRKIVEQDLGQLSGQHGPPRRGKADLELNGQIGFGEFAGGAHQDLLSRTADADQAAFAGAPGLEGEASDGPSEGAQDIVRQRGAFVGKIQIFLREARPAAVHINAETGGRSEGVSLHVIDG